MFNNTLKEQDPTLIELDAIVAANDIVTMYEGVNEILLARLIDNAICLTTNFRHLEKKYRRHQANDFSLPVPYFFVKKESDKFLCKKITIPSPYFLSSHDSSELYFNFSGIIFDEREATDFFNGDFFKSYQDNHVFYSLLLGKVQNEKEKSEDEIFTIEIMQEIAHATKPSRNDETLLSWRKRQNLVKCLMRNLKPIRYVTNLRNSRIAPRNSKIAGATASSMLCAMPIHLGMKARKPHQRKTLEIICGIKRSLRLLQVF